MPYVTNGYIFSLAPSRVPFFIRPLANKIFSTMNDLLVKPHLQANIDYVVHSIHQGFMKTHISLTDQYHP